MESTMGAQRPTGAVGAIVVGGVVVVVGGLLAWFELTSSGGTQTVKGTDLSMGLGTMVFGGIAAVAGIVALVRAPRTGGRAWSVTALVFVAIALIATAYAAFAPETAITEFGARDVAEGSGISENVAKAALEQAFASGQLSATAEVGTYVSLGGSLIGVAGAIGGLVFANRRRRTGAPAPDAAAPPPPPPPAP